MESWETKEVEVSSLFLTFLFPSLFSIINLEERARGPTGNMRFVRISNDEKGERIKGKKAEGAFL